MRTVQSHEEELRPVRGRVLFFSFFFLILLLLLTTVHPHNSLVSPMLFWLYSTRTTLSLLSNAHSRTP